MDWVKNLKAGDTVILHNRYQDIITAVEKVTPTGRIKVDGIYFDPSGHQRGADLWTPFLLREATPKAVEEINRSNTIRRALRAIRDVREISYDQAVKLLAVLEPKTGGK